MWNEATDCGETQKNSSSCIDLIFTNQPNLIMDSRVHPTLHSKCNHQIIYPKLNLEIKYPSTYAREVWDHGKAQFDLVNVAIENFDWNKLLSGHNIRNQINLFNRTILKFFRNFIPNVDILCDGKKPPWVNDEFKLLIKRKNVNIQTQMRDNRLDLSILNKLIKEINSMNFWPSM